MALCMTKSLSVGCDRHLAARAAWRGLTILLVAVLSK